MNDPMNYLAYWNYWKTQLETIPENTKYLALTLGMGIILGVLLGWLLASWRYRSRETFFSFTKQTLDPLQRMLDRFNDHIRDIEKQRISAYERIAQQIDGVIHQIESVGDQDRRPIVRKSFEVLKVARPRVSRYM
jgi:hypothetical protein